MKNFVLCVWNENGSFVHNLGNYNNTKSGIDRVKANAFAYLAFNYKAWHWSYTENGWVHGSAILRRKEDAKAFLASGLTDCSSLY